MPASTKISTTEAMKKLNPEQRNFKQFLESDEDYIVLDEHPGTDVSGGLNIQNPKIMKNYQIKLSFTKGNFFRTHGFLSERKLNEMIKKYPEFLVDKNPKKAQWNQPSSRSFKIPDSRLEDVGKDLARNMKLK